MSRNSGAVSMFEWCFEDNLIRDSQTGELRSLLTDGKRRQLTLEYISYQQQEHLTLSGSSKCL